MNVENLKVLSDGLLGLIKPVVPIHSQFDMRIYSNSHNQFENYCGSVGCAIGFAPFFGIKKDQYETWVQFFNKKLISTKFENSKFYAFMFGAAWSAIDNSKRGAGLRIKYFLNNGLPHNWDNDYSQEVVNIYNQI